MDGVRPRPSWPNEGRRELLVTGVGIVSRTVSGDRGVEAVQDVAAAGADPVVSAAASAVAGVGLARGTSWGQMRCNSDRQTRLVTLLQAQTKQTFYLLIAAELSFCLCVRRRCDAKRYRSGYSRLELWSKQKDVA